MMANGSGKKHSGEVLSIGSVGMMVKSLVLHSTRVCLKDVLLGKINSRSALICVLWFISRRNRYRYLSRGTLLFVVVKMLELGVFWTSMRTSTSARHG